MRAFRSLGHERWINLDHKSFQIKFKEANLIKKIGICFLWKFLWKMFFHSSYGRCFFFTKLNRFRF